nr:neprilysin-1-like [Crassostrea gigas]
MSTSKQNLTASSMTIAESDVHVGMENTKKSSSKIRIFCLMVLALVAIIAVSVALAVVVIRNKENDDDSVILPSTTADPNLISSKREVCISQECILAASNLINSIDPKADPCNDFYQFACGKWRKKQVIPEYDSITGVTHKLNDELDIILKHLLERNIEDSDIEAVRNAKRYYQSCVDVDAIEKDNLTSIKQLIEDLGGWPVLNKDWKEENFNLTDLLIKITLYTANPLIFMFVYRDFKNPTNHMLYIDQPALGLPDRKYFLRGRDHRQLVAYEQYAREMAIIFGADETTASNDIKDILDFEIQIAQATSVEGRDQDKLYNKMTIGDLQTRYPNFQWLEFIQAIFGRDDVNISVDITTTIVNRDPDYIENIFNRLNSYSKRTIQNYVIWRTLNDFRIALTTEARGAYVNFNKVLSGSTIQPPRWKTCVSETSKAMGLAVVKPFLDETFDVQSKYLVDEMIENLRLAMKELIRSSEWMDNGTILKAVEKADQMVEKIGYPAEIKNETFLNERYRHYKVNETKFFENFLLLTKQSIRETFKELLKPVDKNKWDLPPTTTNAFYDNSANQILIPAGIIQPPFFKKGYPQYLNYGGIGYSIGREITHGFDKTGREYDGSGILRKWWSNGATFNFIEKTECMSNQYNSYAVEEAGQKLNGDLTLDENIADNGGLKESWMAYEKWLQTSRNGEPEPFLPGLNYTPKQLFFLNAAHIWCGLVRPDQAANLLLTDKHADFKSRVIGPLQNNKEFSNAFNCPLGSYMNPKDKCVVW